MTYVITHATEEHLSALQEIELQAATLFSGLDLPQSILEETTPLPEFRAAMAAGHLWVALTAAGEPVGFAHAESHGATLHLEELDVRPAYGRRGIGRALVEAVCSCARAAGQKAVTLTTFRAVPWNAPFYARLGFCIVAPDALSEILLEVVAEEARRGLPSERRVVMRREV